MLIRMYKAIFQYRTDGEVDALELLKTGIYHGEITNEECQRVKEILNRT